MLIARIKEQSLLRNTTKEDNAQLVAVYGRRRVGKTYLIKETFNYKFTFYHTGLAEGTFADQLHFFQYSLQEYGMKDAPLPKNWLEAFQLLKKLLTKSRAKHKIVFIDELPWMDTPNSRFVSAFEGFWNQWASNQKHLTVIVCGSATSWMINKIVRNQKGLSRRVTRSIPVAPFTLEECEKLAAWRGLGMSRRHICETYMIMGGVPYYWSLLDKRKSLDRNIDDLFFSKDGELQDEFKTLYRSLFTRSEPYIKIISVLGKRKTGLTRDEIQKGLNKEPSGHLSEMLQDLENCGFIRQYIPYGKKIKDAVYQIIDNYTLFYFDFIAGKKRHEEHFWSNTMGSAKRRVWAGLSFERVGLLHLNQIKAALGIAGISTAAYSWTTRTDKGVQIDLLLQRADGVINLCEMKYAAREYSLSAKEHSNLIERRERFIEATKCKDAVQIIMVTPYGLAPGIYNHDIQATVTFSDLFAQ